MNAEIISIGDELLLGQVIDTNSAWLGQELNRTGIKVHYKSSISDTREAILTALADAEKRSELIILTGGLGPTKDDITKKTICDYFEVGLVLNQDVLNWVQQIFSKRNLPMLDSNNQQAMLPQNSEVLWNRSGTAPGMWIERNGKVFISMPGVPFEMKTIFSEEALPRIQKQFTLPSILHRTFQTVGIGESFLARKIAAMEDALPMHIKLAYLPSVGMVRLRLSAYGQDKEQLSKELEQYVTQLYSLAGEYIYAEGEESMQEHIGKLLKKNSLTLATAESCTGGYLSHLITSVPGSSAYYLGSVISYHNRIKIQELQVSEDILKNEGAVSEACVRAMAENLRTKMKSDYAVATSGIAGPDGGTAEKPVGTVWIAVASATETVARVYLFGDNRERTIHRTAIQAMDLMRRMIENKTL